MIRRATSSSVCYQIIMRAAVLGLAMALVSCMQPGTGSECHIDDDCGTGEVCARDQLCVGASTVRLVTATWTVTGMPASTAACGNHANLYIQFVGNDLGDTLGYAPVPCANGRFTVDKLPNRYWQVELGIEGGFSDVKPITADNTASLNVVF
jgi:hypothetical protein